MSILPYLRLPKISQRMWKVWVRDKDVFMKTYKVNFFPPFIEPLLYLFALGFGLGFFIQEIEGIPYPVFIAPGLIAISIMNSSFFECTFSSYVRMWYQKTFDAIIATPLNIEDVTAGEIFWGATRSVLTGSVMLAVAAAFQLVHSPWALLIPIICFLEGILFSAIALFFTSIVPSIYSFNYYYSLFITPMFFFSGVFFPLSSFPDIVRTLSWAVPLTPVVYVTRAVIGGEFQPGIIGALALIVALITLFFSMSLVTMRRRLAT